jgi:hypothetical protein
MKRLLGPFLLMMLGAGCAQHSEPPPANLPGKLLVTFSAMGDVPYKPEEDALLAKQLWDIPRQSEFVIHLGDIQANQKEKWCSEAKYQTVDNILSRSPRPLFIIPGDNEYNDCPNPEQGWGWWVKHFMRFDQRWPHRFRVFRQLEREENFAFVQNGVLFVSIHLVSGRVHDPEEWRRRHEQDMQWVAQTMHTFKDLVGSAVIFSHAFPTAASHHDCLTRLSDEAAAFAKPVLYLQGDGHKWLYDHPFKTKNVLRVQVDMGGIAPPITVRITDDPKQPFYFDRRITLPPPTSKPATKPATQFTPQ